MSTLGLSRTREKKLGLHTGEVTNEVQASVMHVTETLAT